MLEIIVIQNVKHIYWYKYFTEEIKQTHSLEKSNIHNTMSWICEGILLQIILKMVWWQIYYQHGLQIFWWVMDGL